MFNFINCKQVVNHFTICQEKAFINTYNIYNIIYINTVAHRLKYKLQNELNSAIVQNVKTCGGICLFLLWATEVFNNVLTVLYP